MNTQLVNFEAPELIAVEPSKAKQIKETFLPMAEMLETFEERFNEIISESKNGITQDLSLKAKRLRLDVAQVRIETGKLKDKQKEKIKIEDKAIMAIHNILVWAVSEKEDKLKAIEKDAEIKEQKRLEALQLERVKIMLPYIEDAENRNFSEMEEDVFQAYFTTKKQAHLDLIEAEKKAEADRIAKEKKEAEERKRIEVEEALAEEPNSDFSDWDFSNCLGDRIDFSNCSNDKVFDYSKIFANSKHYSKEDADKVKDLISDLKALKTKYTFKSKTNQKMFVSVCDYLDKLLNFISK